MKRRSLLYILACTFAAIALTVGIISAKPHINRLLDNRDRAIIVHHNLLLESKIQALGHQDNAYPSSSQVGQVIADSGFINPHTHKPYVFIGSTSDLDQIKDGQISYGLGDTANSNTQNDKASYICIGIGMPRTHEGGSSCDNLRLDKNTDLKLKYYLSCKTNWLGFSTGCDTSLLQSL